MADITFHGNPVHTSGQLPAKGAAAPDFKLTATDLSEATLASWPGKKKILNIFPSIDTGVCAASARAFNQRADANPDLVILNVSADLPFAHARFCGAEGLERVIPLSMMRSKDFARDYGVLMQDGPLAGLAARAVVALDENNRVIYTEQVPEIGQEPNYDAALAAVQ